MMKSSYRKVWVDFLERWGLKTLAREMIDHARLLFPLAAQALVLGPPLFKNAPFGGGYQALLDTFGNKDRIDQFSQYLQGGGV